MDFICQRCHTPLNFSAGSKPSRRDTCPKCGNDLHSCLNCQHYDRASYRECRENIQELVKDKERSNFCDSFTMSRKTPSSTSTSSPQPNELLKAAEALFKKKS